MAQNNKRNYTQSFTYDKIGNMLTKVSTESKYPNVSRASSKLTCDQPYREKWILDQNDSSKYDMIPYRFTAKERDEETGLYYMSARYQNPEASRWISADSVQSSSQF